MNGNFKKDYIDAFVTSYDNFSFTDTTKINCGEAFYVAQGTYGRFLPELAQDEVLLNLDIFNIIFGTQLEEDEANTLPSSYFEGIVIDIEIGYNNGTSFFNKTLKVKGIAADGAYAMSKDYLKTFKEREIIQFALYLADSQNAVSVLDAADSLAMYQVGDRYTAIREIVKIVKIFSGVFGYIAAAVCIAIVGLLMLNSYNGIKRSSYEIGVIRSMGGRTGQVSALFAIQTGAVGLVVCILTAIGSYLGVLLFNNVLISSIAQAVKMPGLADVNVLYYNPAVVAIDVLAVLLLSVASVIIPILAIRKMQPVKIIRSRE